jgi:hypothetical protein
MVKPWADKLLDNDVKGATVAMLAEIDELRAELAALKNQKPVAIISKCSLQGVTDCVCADTCIDMVDVYLAPGAQPVKALQFPTAIRKMWSGREVQEWIDRHESMLAAVPKDQS